MQKNDNWVGEVIRSIPEYATELGTELDTLMNDTLLEEVDAHACALAAAIAASNGPLAYEMSMNGPLRGTTEREVAFKAAAYMGKNNVWNRFTKIAGGDTLLTTDEAHKSKFDMYALSASVVGGDEVSIKSYMNSLTLQGLTTEHLHTIAKIASIVSAVGKITP